MNECAVGIDVSKRKLDICVLRGRKAKTKVLPNDRAGHDALHAWLMEQGLASGTPVCLEATGPYSEAVAVALVDQGWTVSVINPARIKGFGQVQLSRNKTDRADARLLASFACSVSLEPWHPPSLAVRDLRALVERLQALQDMRQQELNRLEVMAQVSTSPVAKMVQEHIAWLDRQINKIERDINDHIDGHPELKQDAELIRSIPGIGDKTAARVLGYLGDVRRFKSAKALAAFVGVTPRQRLSGTSVRGRTMLSRTGHADARKALYMPGLVAVRHNPVIMAMAERLRTRGLAPKAIVGASMRRLVHMIYGVVTSGTPFDAKIPLNGLAVQDGI
ncbi:IS110 family transposase [uncultured Abyssibacter sp.]|uniref:IS110 family transposase n=1 Tax=uncultured Abyssibacter sp. TaxID=2320202 RepID=UPI0032B1080C